MAEGLNRVMCIGNLAADPELRVTQGGASVLKLRLGCTESYLDKSNVRQEKTEWVSCTMWGKRGESLSKFLKKGDRVYVEGGLRTSSYEKSGEKRYSTEVNVTNLILCGGGKGGDSEEPKPSRGGYGGSSRTQAVTPPADAGGNGGFGDFTDGGDDSEIPFILNETLTYSDRV